MRLRKHSQHRAREAGKEEMSASVTVGSAASALKYAVPGDRLLLKRDMPLVHSLHLPPRCRTGVANRRGP
jgi:hypothetical protein